MEWGGGGGYRFAKGIEGKNMGEGWSSNILGGRVCPLGLIVNPTVSDVPKSNVTEGRNWKVDSQSRSSPVCFNWRHCPRRSGPFSVLMSCPNHLNICYHWPVTLALEGDPELWGGPEWPHWCWTLPRNIHRSVKLTRLIVARIPYLSSDVTVQECLVQIVVYSRMFGIDGTLTSSRTFEQIEKYKKLK